ncbi:phosphohexomutase domain-containing protein [Brevibacillus migulae]|uniref:hypothetical protein n=1 Tax=Brevibacillus migulae TaxID=1644114 RepID=UPI00106E67E4|nr:hypothetical protein [Brevibacillus migulae]
MLQKEVVDQSRCPSSLFTPYGMEGAGNREMTVEVAVRLASAYAYVQAQPTRIGISACAHPFSQLLKHGMMTSLCCAGMETVDFGICTETVLQFGMKREACQGSIHLVMNRGTSGAVEIIFLDQEGQRVTASWTDRVKEAFVHHRHVPRRIDQLGRIHVKHDVQEEYVQSVIEMTRDSLQKQ